MEYPTPPDNYPSWAAYCTSLGLDFKTEYDDTGKRFLSLYDKTAEFLLDDWDTTLAECYHGKDEPCEACWYYAWDLVEEREQRLNEAYEQAGTEYWYQVHED